MDDKKKLNDEELEEVSGGVTSGNSELKVTFDVRRRLRPLNFVKREIKEELLNRGVPMNVAETVLLEDFPMCTYVRVEWESGWEKPQYTIINY